MFSVLHNIISNLDVLLFQPFNIMGYLANLLCHLSYFVMELSIIDDQYFIIGY